MKRLSFLRELLWGGEVSGPGVGLSLPLPCAAGVRARQGQRELAPEQLDARAKIKKSQVHCQLLKARRAEDRYVC